MSRTWVLIFMLFIGTGSAAEALSAATTISRPGKWGQATHVDLTGKMPPGDYLLTVAHFFIDNNIAILDCSDVRVAGCVNPRIIAISIKYDVCLIQVDGPAPSAVTICPAGIDIYKGAPLVLMASRTRDGAPAEFNGQLGVTGMWDTPPGGLMWEIISYYKMGFSGAGIMFRGNLLGMSAAGYSVDDTARGHDVRSDHGMFVPAKVIRQVIDIAARNYNGESIVIHPLAIRVQ